MTADIMQSAALDIMKAADMFDVQVMEYDR